MGVRQARWWSERPISTGQLSPLHAIHRCNSAFAARSNLRPRSTESGRNAAANDRTLG